MNKHTDGPWVAMGSLTQEDSPCFDVVQVEDKGLSFICEVSGSIDELTANAHLIAAAPELLEALEDAYDHLGFCGYGDSYERECAGTLDMRIESAIAKAKGV